MARTRNRRKKSRENQSFSPTTPNHKYGLITVNNITYGNPNAEQAILVEKLGTFDYIANHFMDKPYPDNDGKYSQRELEQITEQMKKLDNAKIVESSFAFDENLAGMCMDVAQKCGVSNPKKFVSSVFKDIDTIIMKLKFFYNRIRPFQLANIYKYPLNPMPTVSAQSPAYPSGHTVQSKVIADILSFKYPSHSNTLENFADKCSKSRIILGVHYPSDEVFGLQVASGICKDENFRKKYFSAQNIEQAVNQSPPQSRPQQGPPHSQFNPNGEVFGGMPDEYAGNPSNQKQENEEIFGGPPKAEQPIPSNYRDDEVFGGLPRQQI